MPSKWGEVNIQIFQVKISQYSRVGEDFWCEVDGLSGADQVQGSAGKDIKVDLEFKTRTNI